MPQTSRVLYSVCLLLKVVCLCARARQHVRARRHYNLFAKKLCKIFPTFERPPHTPHVEFAVSPGVKRGVGVVLGVIREAGTQRNVLCGGGRETGSLGFRASRRKAIEIENRRRPQNNRNPQPGGKCSKTERQDRSSESHPENLVLKVWVYVEQNTPAE